MIYKEVIKPINYLLEKQANELNNKLAFSDQNEDITYKQLNLETANLGKCFKKFNINTGESIAIILPNSVNWIVSCFSILRSGCVVVPISFDSTFSEIEYKIMDASCRLIITSKKFKNQLDEFISNKSLSIQIIYTEDIGNSESHLKTLRSTKNDDYSINDDNIDLPGYILYTSGTTGQPKGVVLSSRSMLWIVASCCMPIIGLNKKDLVLSPLPLFHSYALNLCVLGVLASGATEYLLEKFSPKMIFEQSTKKPYTLLPGVPTMFHYLLATAKKEKLKINNINRCVSAGAIMPSQLNKEFEDFFKIELLDGYGITETSTFVTMNWPGKNRTMGSCGLALPGLGVRIINPENHKDASLNQEGELICRGPNVMQGYHNKPEETKKVLKDGWYYTGDLAKQDENGFLTITGRLKEIIIRGGQNISPTEVEEAILKNEKVLDCAVVGLPHDQLGEIPGAFVILKEGYKLDEKNIIDECKKIISDYKVPEKIIETDNIPRTGSGKTMRYKLIQSYKSN